MSHFSDVFALPKGLRVLVTAGASGIGRAISDLLIDGGARVHICDVSDDSWPNIAPRIRRSARPRRTFLGSGRRAPVRRRPPSLGGLDALINNAGIAGPTGGVEEIRRRTGEERSTSA